MTRYESAAQRFAQSILPLPGAPRSSSTAGGAFGPFTVTDGDGNIYSIQYDPDAKTLQLQCATFAGPIHKLAVTPTGPSVNGQPVLCSVGNDGKQQADDPTLVPFGGPGAQTVGCVIATPPDYMDDASNIIRAGVYEIAATVAMSTAPTVPGLFCNVNGGRYQTSFTVDALVWSQSAMTPEVWALGPSDLPFAVQCLAVPGGDPTAVMSVQMSVVRLLADASEFG